MKGIIVLGTGICEFRPLGGECGAIRKVENEVRVERRAFVSFPPKKEENKLIK